MLSILEGSKLYSVTCLDYWPKHLDWTSCPSILSMPMLCPNKLSRPMCLPNNLPKHLAEVSFPSCLSTNACLAAWYKKFIHAKAVYCYLCFWNTPSKAGLIVGQLVSYGIHCISGPGAQPRPECQVATASYQSNAGMPLKQTLHKTHTLTLTHTLQSIMYLTCITAWQCSHSSDMLGHRLEQNTMPL